MGRWLWWFVGGAGGSGGVWRWGGGEREGERERERAGKGGALVNDLAGDVGSDWAHVVVEAAVETHPCDPEIIVHGL